jgi:hypothetical protein
MRPMRRDGGHEAHARLALTRRVTMKTEDEVYLSAYLDGELDPDQRSSVESAMLSNPALAERYRQLTAVRDLIANLPRPTLHEDLSSAILARTSARVPDTLGTRLRRLPLATLGLAVAALTLLSVGLTLLATLTATRPHTLQPLVVANAAKPKARPSAVHRVEPQPPEILVARGSEVRPVAPPPRPAASRRPEADLQADLEQRRIRELLDSPELKQVFVVVDEIGGDMPGRVEDLVRRTPRIDPVFGKITVTQGIVIDPKHPNEATVFALVMDQREVEQFRNQLKQDFPTQFEETAPDPSVVTQLSGIGQVAVLSGTRATELAPTPASEAPKTALRTPRTPEKREVVVRNSPEFDGLPVRVVDPRPPLSAENPAVAKSSPERESSAPPASSDTSKDASGSTALAQVEPSAESTRAGASTVRSSHDAGQRPTSIVLVWVTSRDPSRKGRH